MLDPRPVGYVIGLLVLALGATMAAPAAVDIAAGVETWRGFALAGAVSVFIGGAMARACAQNRRAGLTVHQAFLLTTLSWLALPVFGALPFVFGAPGARYVDAFFEAMSGLTTTGSTVFTGLSEMPDGVLLWRGMLQWFGGVGIVVFAMAFLPVLKVGGMQVFRSEAFDTLGKVLPRAAEIATSIGWIYVGLTVLCMLAYGAAGMEAFDALVHAMTTIATGGFANHDDSFAAFGAGAEYVGALFMLLAALPFVRYIQLTAGTARPLFEDSQIRTLFGIVLTVVATLAAYRAATAGGPFEANFRQALFNGVSILTGTGYVSADYGQWGPFAVTAFFLIGLIGGCAGSTSCSIKVFRFQIVAAAVSAQIRSIQSPHGVFTPRFGGRRVEGEVISSVMSFLFFFFLSLGVVSVALAMVGLAPITAISGAATALANVGPALGPEIGPAGNFAGLPDSAKWLLSAAMLFGRLEILSVLVLFSPAFWRS